MKLGTAFRELDRKEGGKPVRLYPCVGLRTPQEEVEANFGQSPFVFDLEAERNDLQQRALKIVQDTHLDAKLWQQKLNQIVTSYLVHHGYRATAQILARDMGTTINEPEDTIIKRQQIRDQVMLGNIDAAIAMTNEAFPTVFQGRPQLLFKARCRKFIELIGEDRDASAGPAEERYTDERLEQILSYGQEVQTMWETPPCNTAENRTMLKEAFSLLAYTDPRKGPMAYLLNPELREPLAVDLNSAILESLLLPGRPALERIVQQASACLAQMRQQEMGQAAFLDIQQFM